MTVLLFFLTIYVIVYEPNLLVEKLSPKSVSIVFEISLEPYLAVAPASE